MVVGVDGGKWVVVYDVLVELVVSGVGGCF